MMKQKFYALTEKEFCKTLSLKSAERDLLISIRVLSATDDASQPTISEMAKQMGRKESTIRKHLKSLRAKGLIELDTTANPWAIKAVDQTEEEA